MRREVFENPSAYNEKVRKSWLPLWIRFSYENHPTIKGLFEKHGDLDLLSSTAKMEPKPALILGSGPSLDDIMPYLKDWQGYLFCSTSQLSTLAYHGIEPDFCFLIDSDPTQLFLLDDYDSAKAKTVLCTHPSVPPAYFEKWKGRFLFFRMNEPAAQGFFSEVLPVAYNDLVPAPPPQNTYGIRTYVMNAGCVPNTIIPFATVRGCSPIFLCGVDFGYPQDQYRFTKYATENGEWKCSPDQGIPKDIPVQLGENGVKTDKVCIFYKYAMVLLWGLSGSPVLSCSRGINNQFPYVDPKEVVEKQGKGFEDLIVPHKTAYLAAQRYLAKRGTFVTKTGSEINTFTAAAVKGWQRIRSYVHYLRYVGRTDWEQQAKWHYARKKRQLDRVVQRIKKDGVPQEHWEALINMPKDERKFTIRGILEDMKYARLAQGQVGSDNGRDGDVRPSNHAVLDGQRPPGEVGAR